MNPFKYFNRDPGGPLTTHQGHIQWPVGEDGPPLRNVNAVALTQAQFERVQHVSDFHRRVFKCWEKAEFDAYVDIRDRAANGWYQIVHIERKFVAEHNDELVILEWLQVYGEIPNGKVPDPPSDVPQVALQNCYGAAG